MTEPNLLARVPLFAMAVIVAGLTLVVVLLDANAALRPWGDYRFAAFAIPVVLALVYLNEYRKLPYEPRREVPTPAPSPSPDPVTPEAGPVAVGTAEPVEPFEDPVEEADRLGTSGTSGLPPADTDAPD